VNGRGLGDLVGEGVELGDTDGLGVADAVDVADGLAVDVADALEVGVADALAAGDRASGSSIRPSAIVIVTVTAPARRANAAG
jgi:hypothetical protein